MIRYLIMSGLLTLTSQGSEIRPFFVYPMTEYRTAEKSWIDLRLCEDTTCSTSVGKVPLSDLKTSGNFSISFNAEGEIIVNLVPAGGKEIPIAAGSLENKWYPPMEMCPERSNITRCSYAIEPHAGTRSVRLRIFEEK